MSSTIVPETAARTAPPGLAFVEPAAASETANILLYGPAGSGKTIAATSAPGPILVINAEGPGALAKARSFDRDIREIRFSGQATLKPLCEYVRAGADGARTITIDTIGAVHRQLLDELGGTKPQIQHYGQVNKLIADLCRFLRDEPINLVLVCHERIDDSETERIVRPLTGGQQLPELLLGEVDIAAYTATVAPTGDKAQRWVGQLVEGRGRRAKDRSGALGQVRELDLAEWLSVYKEALTASATDNTDAATPTGPQA